MTGPWLGQGMPEDASWFSKQIENLQRQINELRAASSLAASSVGAGGITSADFDGQLDPPQAGTAGWGLSGKNGNAIFNNIVLRGGIIGNDALTSPVGPDRCDGTTTGITLTTTQALRHRETLTVPAGFSQSLVMAIVQLGGTNNSGAADNLLCNASINGVDGDTVTESVTSAFTSHSIAAFSQLVTGLSGGSTINIDCEGHTSAGTWTGQTARVTAIALYIR